MRPLEALNIAMVQADAAGDTDAVNRLYAMRDNPAAVARLMLALGSSDESTQAFADEAGQYGCALMPLVGEDGAAVLALGQRIALRDLAPKGLEWEPHITVLHGIHDQYADQIQTVAKGFGPVAVRLGMCSVFPATPEKPYDVLKIEVDSPDVMALNRALAVIPHTESYPFNPHITIAYLKPARGYAYARRFGNVGKSFALGCIIYSDPLKRQTAIPLGATESFADWKEGVSPHTGEQGWLSSGGQFRKEKPQGETEQSAEPPNHKANTQQLGDTVAKSLAGEPELHGKPELLARVKDLAITAGAKVLLAVNRIQDHWSGKVVAELVDAYFDSPMDMKKLGYNPGNSAQTAHPKVRDDVSSAINDAIGMGLSGHLVAKIAAEVLSRGFLFLRNKVRGQGVAKMADDGTEGSITDLAKTLAAIFDEVNESLGLDGKSDPDTIAKAIQSLRGTPPTTKMADDEVPDLHPVTAGASKKPAGDEVALAGADGRELMRVIRAAKALGVKRVAAVMDQAARRYTGEGNLLDDAETGHVADALAAVNATAELLGRARVRELQERAGAAHVGEDKPFHKFADELGGGLAGETAIGTPQGAYDYFAKLYPKIGVDPERFASEQRRKAFTLAATMDANVTADIQKRIADALEDHTGTADATNAIQQALTAAGVTHQNPQYSEMVFRTNAMDAYQTGSYEEAQHPDVADLFPVWQYLGIKDGRQGKDHEPHFDKYYPRTKAFADVRGDRPFNCRCSLRWVDQFEWDDLKAGGAKEE